MKYKCSLCRCQSTTFSLTVKSLHLFLLNAAGIILFHGDSEFQHNCFPMHSSLLEDFQLFLATLLANTDCSIVVV